MMKWASHAVRAHLREALPADSSDEELDAIHKEAVRAWKKSRPFRLGMIPFAVMAFGAFIVVRQYFPYHWFNVSPWLTRWLASTVIMSLILLAFYRFVHFAYEREFRRAARRRGFEVCLGCGYYLAPLPADVCLCPECGRTRIALSEKTV